MKMKTVKLLDTGQRNETVAHVLPKPKGKSQYKLSSETRERNRINIKKWRANNPDKYKQHLEYVKQWKRNNPDKVQQYSKTWYDLHGLEYYHDHKEVIARNREDRRNEIVQNDTKNIKSRSKVTHK